MQPDRSAAKKLLSDELIEERREEQRRENEQPAAYIPERIREARKLAHHAVTEGVNLAYVERLRQELYKLADAYEALDARVQRQEADPAFRYQLVVETDEYSLLNALHEVASAALGVDSEITWTARSDEEVARGR